MDRYRHLTHRLHRAERRFIVKRDAALLSVKASPETYALTESRIDRVRQLYSETYKSLARASYDPLRMKNCFSGMIMKMTDEQYEDWKAEERAGVNELMSRFSSEVGADVDPKKEKSVQDARASASEKSRSTATPLKPREDDTIIDIE